MESLGYMLIYFYFGKLVWKDYTDNEMIRIVKNTIINDENNPKIIIKYFKIIKCLEFKEKLCFHIFRKCHEHIGMSRIYKMSRTYRNVTNI